MIYNTALLLMVGGLILLSPYLFESAHTILGPTIVGKIPPEIPIAMIVVSVVLARVVKRMTEDEEEIADGDRA